MKKLKYLLSLILVCFCFQSISAKEVTFLPSYILGNPPKLLKAKDDLQSGIAELTGFYAKEHFYIDVTNFSELRNYIRENKVYTDKKPTKVFLSSICSEFDSDYLVHSELDFGHIYNISTEVYNCQGDSLLKRQDILKNKFYHGIERHIKKILRFFPPRTKYKKSLYQASKGEEVILGLDLSGSISVEVKKVLDYLNGILGNSNLAIGSLLIHPDRTKVVNPSFNHAKLRRELSSIRYGGDVSLKDIATAVQNFKRRYKPTRLKNKKFILLTDAIPKSSNDNSLSIAISSLRRMGLSVHIVTGSFFNHHIMKLYQRAAYKTKNPLYHITHAQTIGTMNGYKTVYLNNTRIYYDNTSKVDVDRKDFKKLYQLDESDVYSKVDFLHPGNMLSVYSKATQDKILEKGKLLSNVAEKVEGILQSQQSKMKIDSPKVLLKSGAYSYWINVKSLNRSLLNKEVFIKTTFINDSFSSTGFTNIPNSTFVYRNNIPKLLVMSTKEIRNSLKHNKEFTCFIHGVILEMK